MQFPFDEPDDSTDSRGFPRALAICVASVLLLALAGLWSLVSHRHQGAEATEPVKASTDPRAKETECNALKPTPSGAPSNPSASRTSVSAKPARTAESNASANGFDSSVPNVTAQTLKLFGEKYAALVGEKQRAVQMTGCRFVEVSDSWIHALPSVGMQSYVAGNYSADSSPFPYIGTDSGHRVAYDTWDYRQWCGLTVKDSDGEIFEFAFAKKDKFGETLLGLKAGKPVALKGEIVALRPSELGGRRVIGQYGFVCTEIIQGQAPLPVALIQQQPTQHTEKSANGFWLSRSASKSDERIVFSLAHAFDSSDGDGSIRFDQNFARASIGRKLEAGDQVFVHDFSVEFLPPDSEQGTDRGRGRGLWFIRDASGKCKLGYDREKLSASEKRRGEPTRRWTSIDDSFFRLIVGRDLTRGERAFLHDPKVDNGP